MKSVEIREELVHRLRRNLVGPSEFPLDDDLAAERLPAGENPSRWYLTGFIAPSGEEALVPPDELEAEEEELFAPEAYGPGAGGAAGDDDEPEPPPKRRRYLPSSIGITAMLPPEVETIKVELRWGDYMPEPPLPPEVLDGTDLKAIPVEWRRIARCETVELAVPTEEALEKMLVPGSGAAARPGGALELAIRAREVSIKLPDDTRRQVRVVTVFLVNRRVGATHRYEDVTYAFQVRIDLCCDKGFVPQHDLSRYDRADEDDRLADLHYRDVPAYAVGLGTATCHIADADGRIRQVHTTALPRAAVERVEPSGIDEVELEIGALADLAAQGGEMLGAALIPLVNSYLDWSAGQRTRAAEDVNIFQAPKRRQVAERLIAAQGEIRERIAAGIALLAADDRARLAFEIANRAVAMAAVKRRPDDPRPKWRPFQLAFILLNLAGIADKRHEDREIVDLLFFPTGGGKTEAYLGLAAFTIAHRRLTGPGLLGAGVSVIMRYTLRLLTLDQLGRAAGLICALELLRTGDLFVAPNGRRLLGEWPIEIGLWVGSDASPNRLGGKGDTGDDTAVTRLRQYQSGRQRRAPAPIKACPWCGTDFEKTSFRCVPNMEAPRNLEIRCANIECDFQGDRCLPILTVDEAIYRRLPAFLIATIDKFASLPWRAEAGAFFGHVDRHDAAGFYGAADPVRDGTPLDNGHNLDPPDLIVQDELHLISGPLGTVAGLYEAAIDRLASREIGGRLVRPKIVASTATVRRARAQIEALFDRSRTHIFPAPGVDRRDSFFAHTVPESEQPARWYLGIAAGGRGPKLVFLQTLVTLLGASEAFRQDAAADPYLTALCYFNALRELGGAVRIVQDEVKTRLQDYGRARRRVDPLDQPFRDRSIGDPVELTSRVSTDDVALAKHRLETSFPSDEAVDVALATNMISVGLDISRLGLMLVQGQPKTAAEYIQATSRVGRDNDRPGLVVSVLNLHKPRDRMHYEQFSHFHETFYRAVEATSVTPWSARALDRALAAVVVAIARHLKPHLTPSRAVTGLEASPDVRAAVVDYIVGRAPDTVIGGKVALRTLVEGLLDDWIMIAREQTEAGGTFTYETRPQRLLHPPLDPALANLRPPHDRFQAAWSMRDVEPGVLVKPRSPFGDRISGAADLP